MIIGSLGILFALFLVSLGLLSTVFWVWMLVDAAKNRGLDQNERVLWIVLVALLHFLGALIYFFVGRPKRKLAPAS